LENSDISVRREENAFDYEILACDKITKQVMQRSCTTIIATRSQIVLLPWKVSSIRRIFLRPHRRLCIT
jgi:hypothetical protein